MRVLGLVATPHAGGRTRVLTDAILAAAASEPDVVTDLIVLGEQSLPFADGTRADDQVGDAAEVLGAIDAADAFVLATPIYRGTQAAALKNLLDLVPRGRYDGTAEPFRAKPVVLAATGSSAHHFLGLDSPSEILRGFFAAYVVPPGVYGTHADFGPNGEIVSAALAEASTVAGVALVALARALAGSAALRSVQPQI